MIIPSNGKYVPKKDVGVFVETSHQFVTYPFPLT